MGVIEFRRCSKCKHIGVIAKCSRCFNFSKFEINKDRIKKIIKHENECYNKGGQNK